MSLSSTNSSKIYKSSEKTDAEETERLLPSKKTTGKRLKFQDIEATAIKKKGIRQQILKGVTGMAKPGELTFIMGSSGAGKTTLLNILTGRNLKNIETSGDVLVNGQSMSSLEMKKISAYVQQDDVFIDKLTVKETLHFAAKFRSPKNLGSEERDEVVNELLVSMNLKKCENTRVGSIASKSLSRGERKRLAFACEILTDPPILFCDEPTSGLDSFMSHRVVKTLRQLCVEGKTVICTIHQPSTSVFKMADSLILLSQGHVVYQGAAQDVGEFFDRCGYPVPKFVNTADHFMRVLSHKAEEKEEIYNDRVNTIKLEYEKEKGSSSTSNKSASSRRDDPNNQRSLGMPRSWCLQVIYLFHRSLIVLSRDRFEMIVKLCQILAMAGVIGSVYYGMSIQKSDLLSIKGFSFTMTQLMHLLFMFQSIPLFWKEYPVVKREYHSNMYCPSAYFIAKSASDMLQYIIFPFIFCTILVFATNLPRTFWPVFHYFMISLILSFISTSLARTCASLFGDMSTGITVLLMVTIPFMIFGGFFISPDSVPIYLEPFAKVSWYRWSYEAYLVAYFRDIDVIPGCNGTVSKFEGACSTGAQFLKDSSFGQNGLWLNYTVLLTTLLAILVVGMIAFEKRVRKS